MKMNTPENFPLNYNPIPNKDSPYFIAIDTGTRNIAFAVFKVDFHARVFSVVELVYLRRDLEKYCPTEQEKMLYINQYAWQLFLKYKPFIIVFEIIALTSAPHYKLSGVIAAQNVTGQLILSAGSLGIPYKALPPTQIKYITAGHSKASKERIQIAVDALLQHSQPLVLKVNHIADSVAIGYTYLKTSFN